MKKTARNDDDIISGRVMGNTLSDFSQRIEKNGKTIPTFLGKGYEVGLSKQTGSNGQFYAIFYISSPL